MITVYKLVNGLLGITEDKFFTRAINSATRGYNFKLHPLRSRLDVRSKFFSQRIVADWNSLPSEVVNATSIDSFKKQLDDHWWDKRFKTVHSS